MTRFTLLGVGAMNSPRYSPAGLLISCGQVRVAIDGGPVVHTSHPAYGYLIQASGARVAWAPEFLEFPTWAAGTDLMFAEAAGWARPIRFAKGTGGHAPALEVAEQAARHGVRRLVFAHIGRPTITALDAGHVPPFGEIGKEGATYTVAPRVNQDAAPVAPAAGCHRARS
jgi:hypothetical protein